MKTPSHTQLPWIFRMIRPMLLLGGILVFGLGSGIARYLGAGIDWVIFILGLAWVIVMQLATFLLVEYYHSQYSFNQSRRNDPIRNPVESEGKPSPRSILLAALTSLAVVASLTVMILAEVKPGPSAIFIMILGFLSGLFYSTPLVKDGSSLETSGYGELLAAFIMGFLIPAFAFILQAGELHRLLFMTTIPLVVICLATFIALETPSYAGDLKAGRCTLMVRMRWNSAMNLHNLLIFCAYLLVGLASLYGQPRFATLAAMFSLPVGMLQFWQIWRIGQGARPNWTALRLNAIATFGLMAYLLTYSYWTH